MSQELKGLGMEEKLEGVMVINHPLKAFHKNREIKKKKKEPL